MNKQMNDFFENYKSIKITTEELPLEINKKKTIQNSSKKDINVFVSNPNLLIEFAKMIHGNFGTKNNLIKEFLEIYEK
jgi:hypothetical protein